MGGFVRRLAKAVWQLRLVQAVIRHERRRGRASQDLLERASQVVEASAIPIESEGDAELQELLASVRAEVTRGR